LDITWKFENFNKTIRIGRTPERINGNKVDIELGLSSGSNIKLGELLDAMCARLTQLGIELSYELDADGRLTAFTFDQKVGQKARLTQEGGFEPEKNQWIYKIKSNNLKKKNKSNKDVNGEKFKKFRNLEVEDGAKIVWKCLKIHQ